MIADVITDMRKNEKQHLKVMKNYSILLESLYKKKIMNYYDRLDYPDFRELLQHKVIKTTADVDISTIHLYNYGSNPRYNNIYIRSPDEYIINWNKEAETLEFKQCLKFNLRCGFGKLINK